MISSSKEADSSKKPQGNTSDIIKNITKVSSSSTSSSSPWLRLKDPRIVRVSRAFGGKDRHSKVCTIRGLRDRRVRLSVPTAIQLYDLQDRLGLNQPSKVVDWLLNAVKDEIDELPPLPSGSFGLSHQELFSQHDHHQLLGAFNSHHSNKIDSGVHWEEPRPNIWSSDQALWKDKSKQTARESTMNPEKENWMMTKGSDREENKQDVSEDQSINFLPARSNHLLHNIVPYGSYYHLEPSSTFPLTSQLGSSHVFRSQTTPAEDLHNLNVVPLPSTLSLSFGGGGSQSQISVCPQPTQPLFPSHPVEIDPRQLNHFQMLSSSTPHNLFSSNSLPPTLHSITHQSMRPLHFSMTPRFFPSHINNRGHSEKDEEFPSK